MRLKHLQLIGLFVLTLLSTNANATVRLNQGFNAFAAAGVNYTTGSFRAGYNAWEGGMLSPGFVGAIKSFAWGQSTYSSFGLGINADGFSSNLGFQAASGFVFDIFWNIGLRGELMGRTNFNGNSVGFGLLGISYVF